MTEEKRFQKRYEAHDTPWDFGKADFNLKQVVTSTSIRPCKAIDIGCGTGDNAIWLSQQGFNVVGIDTAETAIEKAKDKASKASAKVIFQAADVLKGHIEGGPFGFAFDRGCFHVLESDRERQTFAENLYRHLEKNGLWLSLIGNADEKRNVQGPPQRSARYIVNVVEPYFEILSLVSGYFASNNPNPPRAWICLMRKRRSE
jgi:2-polyprenyl-3-methyl-5-hydroxy-6-metoxy-1,4-benzoquinol methylase